MIYQQLFAFFFIVAIIFSIMKSVKGLRRSLQLRKNGVQTMARIVGFDTQKDSGGMQYFPIVRFVAQTRGEIEVKIEEVRANEPKVGKEVSIFYDALDPREVTINNKWILYFQIFSILVEVFLIYCFAYFIVNHKWLY